MITKGKNPFLKHFILWKKSIDVIKNRAIAHFLKSCMPKSVQNGTFCTPAITLCKNFKMTQLIGSLYVKRHFKYILFYEKIYWYNKKSHKL